MKAFVLVSLLCFSGLAMAQPEIALSITDSIAAEAGPDSGTFRFTLTDGALGQDQTVNFDLAGSASLTTDYSASGLIFSGPPSIVIPAGDDFFDLVVLPVMDVLQEADETVTVTLRDDVGNFVAAPGSEDPMSLIIVDDPPVISLSLPDATASEAGPDSATIRFTRTGGNLAQTLRVSFDLSGSATLTTDYSVDGLIFSGPPSIEIPGGSDTFDFVVVPVMDILAEGDELVTITLRDDVGSFAVDPGSVGPTSITITDDAPVVSLTAPDSEAAEAPFSPGVFRFSRTGGSPDLTLQVFFDLSGSASVSTDYDLDGLIFSGPLSIMIPAGEAAFDATLSPLLDANNEEGDETATIVLRDDAGSYLVDSMADSATITIADFVDFIFADSLEDAGFAKRCGVDKSMSATPARFFDLGATVVDVWTGLQWSRCGAHGAFRNDQHACATDRKTLQPGNPAQVVYYNLGLSGDNAGFTDWRAPTQEELKTLNANGCMGMAVRTY